MGMSGQRHAPGALYPRGNNPRYPLDVLKLSSVTCVFATCNWYVLSPLSVQKSCYNMAVFSDLILSISCIFTTHAHLRISFTVKSRNHLLSLLFMLGWDEPNVHPPGYILCVRACVCVMIIAGNKRTRKNHVPVPLWPPQIPQELKPRANSGLRGAGLATNLLPHGTAMYALKHVIK
jgi:hypothetical protein